MDVVSGDKLETAVGSTEVETVELITGVVAEVEVSVIVVIVVTMVWIHSRPLTLSFFFLLHLTFSAT